MGFPRIFQGLPKQQKKNGISQDFSRSAKVAKKEGNQINLLFLGR
jgi:hypothetical protein